MGCPDLIGTEIIPIEPDLDHSSVGNRSKLLFPKAGAVFLLFPEYGKQSMPKEILSKRITSPNIVEFERQRQGIALVIFNEQKQILLGRQNHAKPEFGRNEGDWNIITETTEPNERFKGTVSRALFEELGIESEEFNDLFEVVAGTYRETNGVYLARLDYSFKIRCIALRYKGDLGRKFRSRDGEMSEFRWAASSEINNYHIEDGALWVIDYYQKLLFCSVS